VRVKRQAKGTGAIDGGYEHSCAIVLPEGATEPPGGARCWGANGYGQLGVGDTTDRLVAAQVRRLTSGVIAIGAGRSHSCALLQGGLVKCWGSNEYGQLGNGGPAQGSTTPVRVKGGGFGPPAP
jgi:hypothetical protein